MENMKIYIPTLGRVYQQRTWSMLPPALREITQLVVSEEEAPRFKNIGLPYLICPFQGKERGRLADVRQWIMETSPAAKVVQLDDDLNFARRTNDPPTTGPGGAPYFKYKVVKGEPLIDLFNAVSAKLDTYAHVSVSSRGNAARSPELWVENQRAQRLLAYQRETTLRHAQIDRMDCMADFDITLQLMRAGYPNVLGYEFCQDHPGTQIPGGCSEYRTRERHAAAGEKLAALHPGFVRLQPKKNKTGGDFGTRVEVVISWKKAYESSQNNLKGK